MAFLIVEDDSELASGLSKSLAQSGWQARVASTAHEALAACRGETFELIILDLGLPDMDGMQLLRTLRSQRLSAAPILILTARYDVDARVAGLDAGGDDYLGKPFVLNELEARIRALLRRGAPVQALVRFGSLAFDPTSRQASVRGAPLDLTAYETRVLEALLTRPGRIVPKPQLLDALYQDEEDPSASRVEILVSRLRRKLSETGARVGIRSLRGLGYRLEAEC